MAKKSVDFKYVKTESYRSYHTEGVFGGITPKGKIYMELFIERFPTPSTIVHEINKDGTLGAELSRESFEGAIRQIECGITFDIEMASVLQHWLEEKIEDHNKLVKATENESK